MIKQYGERGTAMIIALVCSVILVGLAGAMVYVSTTHLEYQDKASIKEESRYMAAEAAERKRAELLMDYKTSGQGITNWFNSIRAANAQTNPTAQGYDESTPTSYNVPVYRKGQNTPQGTQQIDSWIEGVSASGAKNTWVDIVGRCISPKGVTSQVTMRVTFGQPRIFDLCVLTTTTNCMCCHLRINGDVGTLGDFRPGWGSEGNNGKNSGNGSYIYGNLYSSGGFKDNDPNKPLKYPVKHGGDSNFNHYYLSGDKPNNLGTNPADIYDAMRVDPNKDYFKINGLKITGDPMTTKDKVGKKLPKDQNSDGKLDFPTLDYDLAKDGANGGVVVGNNPNAHGPHIPAEIYGIPMQSGKTFSSGKENLYNTGLPATYDGNVVLIGTEHEPIDLTGDIVVSGDAIVKGYFTGRGTIYAGRNIYVAGDIVTVNPMTNYQSLPEDQRDSAAQADIESQKDAVRLGASNNVILGNYTYRNDGDYAYAGNHEILAVRDRQPQDYYRCQFGMSSGSAGYFMKENSASGAYAGKELEKVGSKYYTDTGQEVPSSQVVTAQGNYKFYDYAMKPGTMDNSGNFHEWISESQYRNIMSETDKPMKYMTWRGAFNKGKAWKNKNELKRNGFTDQQANWILNAGKGTTDKGSFAFHRSSNNDKYFTLRVIYEDAITFNSGGKKYRPINEIGRIDAYLYANKRVAGKTAGKNLVLNGGMIGNEIGILAPGYRKEWWMPWKYNNKFSAKGSPNGYNDQYGDGLGGKWGFLTINYDYRMRNGGQGFPLLQGGEMGQRVFWTNERYIAENH